MEFSLRVINREIKDFASGLRFKVSGFRFEVVVSLKT